MKKRAEPARKGWTTSEVMISLMGSVADTHAESFPMSTSFIYHAFGAQTFDYQSTQYKEGAIYVFSADLTWIHIRRFSDPLSK